MKEEIYGKMPDGREVKIFTLTNQNGLKARVMEYGAILVSMETPDKYGKHAPISPTATTRSVAGSPTPPTSAPPSAVSANRINDGKFTLDGKEYTLATNNEPGGIPCHLHGGLKGFDKVLWTGEVGRRQRRAIHLRLEGRRGGISRKRSPSRSPTASMTTTS